MARANSFSNWAASCVGSSTDVAWAAEFLKTTLACVDALHLGRFTLLLCTDSSADMPVAFAPVSRNDQKHMRGFLNGPRAGGCCRAWW